MVRPQAINLLVGEEEPSYSFDRAGRLFGAFVGGRNYRRSLDNRVLEKWRADGGRQRRWLPADQARGFLEAAYRLARQVAAEARRQGAGEEPDLQALEVLLNWDWEALLADAARFQQIYRPVSILPPDQYLALVFQATEGCSYNRCTFCDFYRDRPFRIKGPDEFRRHVADVRAFFGPALGLRRSVFLADANALVAPMGRLRAWMQTVHESGILPGAGLYSFIDAFDVGRKSLADWQELRSQGLRRVYIGLESGDEALLAWLRKPGSPGDAVEAVVRLKSAGVLASVIVMTGIGGDRFAAQHVANTASVLNAMPLGSGDIIYFSPFVDHPGSEYGHRAAQYGIEPLPELARVEQETDLRAAFRAIDPARPPQLSRYDIRDFIY
jgi:radical SAM superfamily enzyme YgiQ (UPF0313 family)